MALLQFLVLVSFCSGGGTPLQDEKEQREQDRLEEQDRLRRESGKQGDPEHETLAERMEQEELANMFPDFSVSRLQPPLDLVVLRWCDFFSCGFHFAL